MIELVAVLRKIPPLTHPAVFFPEETFSYDSCIAEV
jgi:hypothetical protein